MNESANSFSGFARECWFAAALADLRGDVFHQDTAILDREDLIHELIFGGLAAADLAIKHRHFRLRRATHSFGSGS